MEKCLEMIFDELDKKDKVTIKDIIEQCKLYGLPRENREFLISYYF